jgi:hypothetical protein
MAGAETMTLPPGYNRNAIIAPGVDPDTQAAQPYNGESLPMDAIEEETQEISQRDQEVWDTIVQRTSEKEALANAANEFKNGPLPFDADLQQGQVEAQAQTGTPTFDQWLAKNRDRYNFTANAQPYPQVIVGGAPVVLGGEMRPQNGIDQARSDYANEVAAYDIMERITNAGPEERGQLIREMLEQSGASVPTEMLDIIEKRYKLQELSDMKTTMEKIFGTKEDREVRWAKLNKILAKGKVWAARLGIALTAGMTFSNPALLPLLVGAVVLERRSNMELKKGAEKRLLTAEMKQKQRELREKLPDTETKRDYFDAVILANPKMARFFEAARGNVDKQLQLVQRLAGSGAMGNVEGMARFGAAA